LVNELLVQTRRNRSGAEPYGSPDADDWRPGVASRQDGDARYFEPSTLYQEAVATRHMLRARPRQFGVPSG